MRNEHEQMNTGNEGPQLLENQQAKPTEYVSSEPSSDDFNF